MRRQLLLRTFVATPRSSLLEWLAYHRAIGAMEIEICLAQPFSQKEPLLGALERAGIVSIASASHDLDIHHTFEHYASGSRDISCTSPDAYMLDLAQDEYLCFRNGVENIQEFALSCDLPGARCLPTRIAGIVSDREHQPGPILQTPRSILPSTAKGILSSRTPVTDDPSEQVSDGGRALILKIPAPTIESFVLYQNALSETAQKEWITQIKALAPIKGETHLFAAWHDAIAEQLDTLMALPDVEAAYQAICAKEIETCRTLRASSPVLQQAAAAATEQPAPAKSNDAVFPRWFSEINLGGENEGFYVRLKHHAVVCIRRDPTRLAVTFDNLSSVNDTSPEREPWAYKFVRDNGYSHLSVMARRKDWYRDPQLITYLERLASDGFFASFDRVIFSGTSMGGFASLAFSSLSPGATVVSFNPQTTLEPALVPWETRFSIGRKRDWSLPYSDCAFEIDEVGKAFVLFDPFFEPDRRHAERLDSPQLTFLKTWGAGHFSPVFLRRAGLLKPIMQHAFDDTLTPEVFYRLFRARRQLPWYRNSLIDNLKERGHDKLASRVTPAFRKLKQATSN